MASITIKLVERDSSSPASSRVHASLCIERSTRARSGECSGVGRARSRARVPSCQRHCPIHSGGPSWSRVSHVHLHGDGAAMPPRCNQLAQAKTGTVPFRCALPGDRLAAHLWLSACAGVCEERRCTGGEPDGAATQVDLKPSAAPASPLARQRQQTQIPSGRRPAPVTGWPGGSPAVHRLNEIVKAARRGEALPGGCRNSKKTPLQATSTPPTQIIMWPTWIMVCVDRRTEERGGDNDKILEA